MTITEWNSTLAKLPVRSIRTILGDLAAIRGQFNDGRKVVMPLVHICMQGGREFEGWVVGIDTHKNQDILILHAPRGNYRFPATDLVYIDVSSIVAVTIIDAAEIAYQLTDGKAKKSAEQEVISQLDVKRFIVQYVEAFTTQNELDITCEVDWDSLPSGSTALRNLKDEVASILDAVSELAYGQGKDTIANAIKSVLVRSGVTFDAKLENGVLTISSAYLDSPQRFSDRSSIQHSIQKLL